MDRSNTNWLYNCETAEEVPRLKHDVPDFLPGQNPFLTRLRRRGRPAAGSGQRRRRNDVSGISRKAAADDVGGEVRVGAYLVGGPKRPALLLPCWRWLPRARSRRSSSSTSTAASKRCAPTGTSRPCTCRAASTCWSAAAPTSPSRSATRASSSSIPAPRLRPTGFWQPSASCRKRKSAGSSTRTLDPDHIGGNDEISKRRPDGQRQPGGDHRPREASASHAEAPGARPGQRAPAEHVLQRTNATSPSTTIRFSCTTRRRHTDGDLIVHFRSSDVIAAGDTFLTTTYPVDRRGQRRQRRRASSMD